MVDVSVLTPSYGYGRFIRDGVLSVLGQSGIVIEHIVQDGGSTDETLDVLKSFGDSVSWVSEPDKGQSDALNKALTRASGRWIAWLNADEFYLPGALARLVHEGDRYGADVVYGDSIFVDDRGCFERLAPAHTFNRFVLRQYGCFISSVSTIFRRSILMEDPWDPSLRQIMDWDLFMRLANAGRRFRYMAHPVGAFRRHADQVTANIVGATDEDNLTRAKFGLPEDHIERWRATRLGRWARPAFKLSSGGYVRQLLASSFSGAEMRWFESTDSMEKFAAMLRKCYGRRAIARVNAGGERSGAGSAGA